MASDFRGPLPVKVDATSNGEFRPVPLAEPVARANAEAERRIGAHARRVGLERRAFLQSLCGAATTFLTLNEAFAALGNTGGQFRVPQGGRVRARGGGRGDRWRRVHLRRPDPHGRPGRRLAQLRRQATGSAILASFPQGVLRRRRPGRLLFCGAVHQARVHGQRHRPRGALVRAPELPENNPLSLEEANRVRVLVDRMAGAPAPLPPRHGRAECRPRHRAPLQLMKDAVDRYPIAAWKCYTQWGPNGRGFALDSPDVGIPFIERARELGVRNICIHKGLLLLGLSRGIRDAAPTSAAPRRLYPDVNFIVYHSGYEAGTTRGCLRSRARHARGRCADPVARRQRHRPDRQMYAELGSVWRALDGRPGPGPRTSWASCWLTWARTGSWGTDRSGTARPRIKIQAFRAFEISAELAGATRLSGAPPRRARTKNPWASTPRGSTASMPPRPGAEDGRRSDRNAQGTPTVTAGRSDVRDIRTQDRCASMTRLIAERGGLPA